MFNRKNANLKEPSFEGNAKKWIAFQTNQRVATPNRRWMASYLTKPKRGMKRQEAAVDSIQIRVTLFNCFIVKTLVKEGSPDWS
jgi:hypothetical protein